MSMGHCRKPSSAYRHRTNCWMGSKQPPHLRLRRKRHRRGSGLEPLLNNCCWIRRRCRHSSITMGRCLQSGSPDLICTGRCSARFFAPIRWRRRKCRHSAPALHRKPWSCLWRRSNAMGHYREPRWLCPFHITHSSARCSFPGLRQDHKLLPLEQMASLPVPAVMMAQQQEWPGLQPQPLRRREAQPKPGAWISCWQSHRSGCLAASRSNNSIYGHRYRNRSKSMGRCL